MIRLGGCLCLPLLLTSRLLLLAPYTPASVAAANPNRIASSSTSSSLSAAATAAAAAALGTPAMTAPPVAKKVNHVMELFGDVRVDDYYWLRDDSRTNPEVLSYLKEENDYVDYVMSGEIMDFCGSGCSLLDHRCRSVMASRALVSCVQCGDITLFPDRSNEVSMALFFYCFDCSISVAIHVVH